MRTVGDGIGGRVEESSRRIQYKISAPIYSSGVAGGGFDTFS